MPQILATQHIPQVYDGDDRKPVDRSRVVITRDLFDKRPAPGRDIHFEGIVDGRHQALSPLMDPQGNYVLLYQLDDGRTVRPDDVTPVAKAIARAKQAPPAAAATATRTPAPPAQ